MVFRFKTEPIAKLPHCQGFEFSPDGKLIAGLPGSSLARLFETKTWTRKLDFKRSCGGGGAAFSPDGKTVVLAENYCYLGTYNVRTGEPICKWRMSKEFHEISGLIMSPSTSEVIYSRWDNRISIFDVKTGKLTRELPATDARASVYAISLSPKGDELAAALTIHGKGGGSSVVVWSWPEGRELRRVALSPTFTKEKSFEIHDLCYSTADRLAAVGRSGVVAIFDAKSGKAVHKLRDAPKRSYAKIAVAPNGSYLACVDGGQLFIWDLATNRLICEMQVNESSSYGVGFSPDTQLIAVAINQVFIWKLDDIIAKPVEKATKSSATTKRKAKVKAKVKS